MSEVLHYPNKPYRHVVILGAGASKAALQQCGEIDANGRQIPLLQEIPQKIPELNTLLEDNGFTLSDIINFEIFYDKLHAESKYTDLRHNIENIIWKFFATLELPKTATIYDYLLLSLTEDDLIATFNWDPFLSQAYKRAFRLGNITKLPQLAFLHGNVDSYICETDKAKGFKDNICEVCNKNLIPSKLLYPTSNKDYQNDVYIKNEWDLTKDRIKTGLILTIFGYSAPVTDSAAKEILKNAWSKVGIFGLIEIVDIKDKVELVATWENFREGNPNISYLKEIRESILFSHPRNSGNALWQATGQHNPLTENPLLITDNLQDLFNHVNSRVSK